MHINCHHPSIAFLDGKKKKNSKITYVTIEPLKRKNVFICLDPWIFTEKKSLTRETVCLAQYMSVSKYSDCKLGPEQSDASFTAIYWNKGKKVELA